MHCPRCGQQQISEEIKFCSRCGFPLALVAEVLAQGGNLAQLADREKNKKWLTRKFGLKLTLLWFLLIVLILVPFAGITGAPGEVIGSLAVLGVCGALLMMALSYLFLSNEPEVLTSGTYSAADSAKQKLMSEPPDHAALSPATSQPATAYAPPMHGWKAPETADLVPNSVTENTTKLLRKEK